jgi:hypothetical protein
MPYKNKEALSIFSMARHVLSFRVNVLYALKSSNSEPQVAGRREPYIEYKEIGPYGAYTEKLGRVPRKAVYIC